MAGFDPDKFLAETAPQAPKAFDPDKFLAETAPPKPQDGAFTQIGKGIVNNLPMMGGVAGAIVGTPLDLISGPLGNVAGSAGGYFLGQAAKDTINHYFNPDEAPKTATEAAKNMFMAPVEGMEQEVGGQTLNKGIGLVGKGISKVAPWLAEKAGKVAASIPEEYTREYLARGGKIDARPVDQIMDELTGHYDNAQTGLENAKSLADQAKDTLKDTKQNLTNKLQDERFQTGVTASEKQAALNKAVQDQKEKLMSVKPPIEMANDVQTAIQDLKSQVKKGSNESYKILDNDSQAYNVQKAGKILRAMADDMNIKGMEPKEGLVAQGYAGQTSGPPVATSQSAPVTAESEGVQNALRSFASRLENTPDKVPATELKKMLQQIDNSGQAMYGQPGFDSRTQAAYKMVRGVIDDVIKTNNPEYAAKMKEVASKTGLLDQALDRFGSPQATVSRLNSIGSHTSGADRQLLQQLGSATDADLMTPVEQHLNAKRLLSSPNEMLALKQGLPEFESSQGVQQKYQDLINPQMRRSIEDAPELIQASDQYSKAQMALDAAKEKADALKSLNPNTVQGKVKALTGARNYGAENTFADVDKATGQNYSQEIKDRAILDAFQKSDTNGARKTVLGGALGSLFGPAGTAAGGAAGFVADKYGGQIFKGGLDTAIGLSKFAFKNPKAVGAFADSISGEVLPFAKKSAGSSVESSFQRAADQTKQNGNDAQKSSPQKGRDKWAGDGFDKVQNHVGDSIELDKQAMLRDPKVKDLLIKASDLKVGSKAMDKIVNQIADRSTAGDN